MKTRSSSTPATRGEPTSWANSFFPCSYSWGDERQFDAFDADATRADDYYRLDAMVTWLSPSQNWRVIASAQNLTEEETYVSMERLNSLGAIAAWPNASRTYSLEVQYDFCAAAS
ncbi:MAG: TonB-dependent receptor [Halioglobus sp.]